MPKILEPLSSLELAVQNLFDYAGMYPPASKSFDDALLTSASFPTTLSRPKLVGSDLVMELSHISEITQKLLASKGFGKENVVTFCLLGSVLKDIKSPISEERLSELLSIETFNKKYFRGGPRCRIVSYEFKLGTEIQADSHFLKIALRNIKSYFQEENILICVEPDLSLPDWQDTLRILGEVLEDLERTSKGSSVALKVRCSGPTGIGAEKLSEVISLVSRCHLDLKATAGLHHPIIEKEKFGNSLGFLNLTVALILARSKDGKTFSTSDVDKCLLNEDPGAFSLTETFGWKDFQIDIEELRTIKEGFNFSIGSCSVHEPDEDLVRLFGKPLTAERA